MPNIPPTREAVMEALLALAATAQIPGGPFQTVSRRYFLVPNSETPTPAAPELQPAIHLLEDTETTEYSANGMSAKPTRIWYVQIWLWCKIPDGPTPGVPDGVTPGASVINNLIEAVESALFPNVYGVQTLGDLVFNCRIEGQTVKVPGDANPDGQCFAAIPIKIIAL